MMTSSKTLSPLSASVAASVLMGFLPYLLSYLLSAPAHSCLKLRLALSRPCMTLVYTYHSQ